MFRRMKRRRAERKASKYYAPILLDILTYNDITKKKGKYYPKRNIHIKKHNPSFDIAERYSDSDYLFVSYEADRVVFSFAPSDDISDWVSDFDAGSHEELDETGIHDGFNKSYKPFIGYIKKHIGNVGSRDIYFTGHSRGGALAQLGAMTVAENGKSLSCITSGAPRLFNKKARNRFDRLPIHCTNVINVHDVVPALPPKIMGYTRTHNWKVIRPKWWYFLPGSFIKIHLDYLSNLKRYTKQ